MEEEEKTFEVFLDHIVAHNPPRTTIQEPSGDSAEWGFERLFLDIKENGVTKPIKVIALKEKGKYQVTDGLKRLAIVEQLGHDRIPVSLERS